MNCGKQLSDRGHLYCTLRAGHDGLCAFDALLPEATTRTEKDVELTFDRDTFVKMRLTVEVVEISPGISPDEVDGFVQGSLVMLESVIRGFAMDASKKGVLHEGSAGAGHPSSTTGNPPVPSDPDQRGPGDT